MRRCCSSIFCCCALVVSSNAFNRDSTSCPNDGDANITEQGWYEHESAPYLHGSSGMRGSFRKKEGQPARSGVGGEEITGTTRGELLVGRGRADVRDPEWIGRRRLLLGTLETIRNYRQDGCGRRLGRKRGGLRLMQHDAERTIVVSRSIFVLMEFQPEGEGRHQQDDREGKRPAQPLIRSHCGHVGVAIPSTWNVNERVREVYTDQLGRECNREWGAHRTTLHCTPSGTIASGARFPGGSDGALRSSS